MNVAIERLANEHARGATYQSLAAKYQTTEDAIRGRIRRYNSKLKDPLPASIMPASPFGRFDSPLTLEGDALILNDLEVPFQDADFVNRTIDLAGAWGITQCVLGGDVLHFEVFSAWGAAWKDETPAVDALSEEAETRLRALADQAEGALKAQLLEEIDKLTTNRAAESDEIKAGARALKALAGMFGGGLYYILGNHDDRFIRRLNASTTPQRLLNFLGLTDDRWHISPYYKAILTSSGQEWYIEHQNGATAAVAVKIADRNEANTICAHNHVQALNWSTSGKYYAISSGHACDEYRMAYASQRSNTRARHNTGAVIVREGVPWLLNPRVDWRRLRMMA